MLDHIFGREPMIKNNFDWNSYRGELSWLQSNTIFLTRYGSHSYGTSTQTSDEDFRGIAIPPKEYYLSFLKHFDQAESKDPDLVIFDIKKFFKLAMFSNPNVLELLFVDSSDYIVVTPFSQALVENRYKFLSKRCKNTFTGYATSQIKRIVASHNSWLLNPIEDALSYNCKAAMHFVRLTRSCKELLATGKLLVRRLDAAELLSIRNGAWTFGQFEEFVADQENEINNLVLTSPLPDEPDFIFLESLCQILIESFYNR